MHLRPSQAAFFAFDVPTSRANDPINISTRWKSGGKTCRGKSKGQEPTQHTEPRTPRGKLSWVHSTFYHVTIFRYSSIFHHFISATSTSLNKLTGSFSSIRVYWSIRVFAFNYKQLSRNEVAIWL